VLSRFGERHEVARGEPVFGDEKRGSDFAVVLRGAVAMVNGYGRENRVQVVHGEGGFLGELGQLSGERMLLTAIAARPSEVLVVPSDRLRTALDSDPVLRDMILRVFLLRRAILLGMAADLRIVGSGASEDTQRLRDFANRYDFPHSWLDLDTDARAAKLLEKLGIDPSETPVAVTRDHQVLRNPDEAELRRAFGLDADDED